MNSVEESNNSCSDVSGSLTERLRRENTDQFLTLVRMHLSFVVDINTDDVDSSTDKPKQFRWGFSKKPKNTPNATASAGNTKCGENTIADEGISKVYELIDFLVKEENVKQEGIFRRTGSLSRQQELKQLLMSGSPLRLDKGRFSVHDCASVLKGFLAELPQPLLMDQYYQTYCTLAVQYPPNAETSKSRLLTALQLLLLLLSPLHRTLLQRLLSLLRVAASHESSNRMSPDTLATMFTPHLLCPRKLGPEALHSDAVALAPVVSFMIRQAERLFHAPAQLSTDVAAYFTMRERRRVMSPDVDLDESISDRTAANTVYTFVDRHRTSAENEANPTDTALAQLYAHIQALPDSQHKRRLIKQFNRQNGYGTPIQVQRTGKAAGSKSLGESIKRHIFNKGLLNKTPKKSGSIPSVAEKRSPFNKDKLIFSGDENIKTLEVSHKNIILKNLAQKMASAESLDQHDGCDSDASDESTQSEGSLLDRAHKMSPKFVSEPNLSILDSKIDDETPKNTRKRTRLFRSKVISATNLNKKYTSKKGNNLRSTPTSCVSCVDEQDTASDSESSSTDIKNENNIVSNEIKMLVANVTPRVSRRDSMKQVQYRIFSKNNDSGNESEVKPLSKLNYLTSTPGVVTCEIEEPSTPYFSNFRRSSMSPITKSTQKLSKAMQESIMTPRSRKPLIITSEQRDTSLVETKKPDISESLDTIYGSMSPKNDSDFVSSDESEHRSHSSQSSSDLKISGLSVRNPENVRAEGLPCSSGSVSALPNFKTSHEMSPFYLKECKSRSLTDPFREYLLSRSVLTAAPVDLSIMNKSDEAVGGISDSLMFCLDGNVPSDLTSSISNLVVDKVIHEEKDRDLCRSPLTNFKNYANINKIMEKSPTRKRSAVSERECHEEAATGTYKKISLTPEVIKDKENLVTKQEEIDISLWETDL